MVDASHTPDEPGSEPDAEAVPAEEIAQSELASETAAAEPIEGNKPAIAADLENLDAVSEATAEPEDMPIQGEPSEPSPAESFAPEDQETDPLILDPEESLILEEQPEDEGPYTSAEDFVDLSESAGDEAASDVVEPFEPEGVDADTASPEAVHVETTAVESDVVITDQALTESAHDAEMDTSPLADPERPDLARQELTGQELTGQELAGQELAGQEAEDWDLGELETTTAADAAQLATQIQATSSSPMQRIQALIHLIQPILKIQPALKLWQRLLRGVRSRLPQMASLSDGVLSGILIGILVLLLLLINGLGQPSAVAVAPPTATAAAAPSELSPEPTTALESPSVEAPVHPDLERIDDIQAQLTAAATSYASQLVVSVQASFGEDCLSANLSSGWYRLPRDQQDQLAADLLGRSQSLEFATLELLDPDGAMVARSPVVGNTMVIMQRQPPPEVPIPERPRYRITLDR